jgi:hypothetical protein
LKAHTVEAVEQLRDLEVTRLDKLQLALWPAAIAGDVHAASLVTRIIMARCRLLGLEGPGVMGVDGMKPMALVVPPVT